MFITFMVILYNIIFNNIWLYVGLLETYVTLRPSRVIQNYYFQIRRSVNEFCLAESLKSEVLV